MSIMASLRADGNGENDSFVRPLPALDTILALFDRLGYGESIPVSVPPLGSILALFDRLGYGDSSNGGEG